MDGPVRIAEIAVDGEVQIVVSHGHAMRRDGDIGPVVVVGLYEMRLAATCIETRQANAAMKTMPNKTDRNDARVLSQIMRTGWFRAVHVKRRDCRLLRSLLVARRTVLNEMRSREAGIKLGTPARAKFSATVRERAGGDTGVVAR